MIDALFEDSPGAVPLDEEFEGWVHEDDDLGLCIQHPLHYSIPHRPELNAFANKSLADRRAALEKARDEERWHLWVILHERPWRIQAMEDIADQISDELYWELLGHLWTDSENIWQNEDRWIELLSAARPGREQMMVEEDREAFEYLPETITIYRGFSAAGREKGISWTLDREKAEWFARRPPVVETPRVAVATVSREAIIALFQVREESEVIVTPAKAEIREIVGTVLTGE